MAKRDSNLRVDRDGVRVYTNETPRASRPRAVALLGALLLVGAAAAIFLYRPRADPLVTALRPKAARNIPAGSANEAEGKAAQATVSPQPRREFRPVHVQRGAPPVGGSKVPASDPSREEQAGKEDQPQEIDAAEVISALKAAGETEGIAAFPPPGTSPPMSGIVVPEDFDLPEGYVRHYQATDDGRRLEPILMFSPDYQFVDASGNPIELPDDLVVPADLAPPGLPIRWLEVPKRKLR